MYIYIYIYYMYIFVSFILTPFDVCFCVDFILVLAKWLTDWPLRGMQNVDRMKSDKISNETDREKTF